MKGKKVIKGNADKSDLKARIFFGIYKSLASKKSIPYLFVRGQSRGCFLRGLANEEKTKRCKNSCLNRLVI